MGNNVIAIVSPASIIDPRLVDGAVSTIESLGYRVRVMPHVLGHSGSYSGNSEQRFEDLSVALLDPEVKAVLCSRGGYGCVHLLEKLDTLLGSGNCEQKWLIGFSDVTALHALWAKHSWPSVHSSMVKQLSLGADTEPCRRLFEIIEGEDQQYEWHNTCGVLNRSGEMNGRLVGGNLAVLDGLAGTRFYTPRQGDILFVEDVAEPIYKIERMFYRMKLSGLLENLGGLIVGRFTEYKPDRNYATMEAMIRDMVDGTGYPVVFDAPIGHIGALNMPLIHAGHFSASVTPTVTVGHNTIYR